MNYNFRYEVCEEPRPPLHVPPAGEGFTSKEERFRVPQKADQAGSLGPPPQKFSQLIQHKPSPNQKPHAPPKCLGILDDSIRYAEERRTGEEPIGFTASGPRFPPPRKAIDGYYDVCTPMDYKSYNLTFGYQIPGYKVLLKKIEKLNSRLSSIQTDMDEEFTREFERSVKQANADVHFLFSFDSKFSSIEECKKHLDLSFLILVVTFFIFDLISIYFS